MMEKEIPLLFIIIPGIILSGCLDSDVIQEEKSQEIFSISIPLEEKQKTNQSGYEWRHPFGTPSANPLFEKNARLLNPGILKIKHDSPFLWAVGGDIDNDSKGEIITLDEKGQIHVLDFDGVEISMKTLPVQGIPTSSPVLGDINGDGLDDIVFVSNGDKINIFISPELDNYRTEFLASPLSFPLLADLDRDGLDEIIYTGENQRINLLKLEDRDLIRYSEEETQLLPDSRISSGDVDGDGNQELVALAYPTKRYPHGPLGDIIEAGGVAIFYFDDDGLRKKYSFELPVDSVFEGLTPIIVSLDNRKDGILLSRSYLAKGSAVALLSIENGLEIIAEGPPIGTSFRWIHSIGGGDFDGDGDIELAAVKTPHIGGILQIYEISDNKLEIGLESKYYSSHGGGSRNLNIPLFGDLDSDGQIEILLPDQSREKIIIMGIEEGKIIEEWSYELGGGISSNSLILDFDGDHLGDLALGDSEGNFYVFLSK